MNSPEYLQGYYSTIMLEDLQLEQILQKGVAETHIHKGASISFLVSWTNLMKLNKKGKIYENEFLCNPFIIKKDFTVTVKVAALLRFVMAVYLQWHSDEKNFSIYLEEKFKPLDKNLNLQQDNITLENRRIEQTIFWWFSDVYNNKCVSKDEETELQISKAWSLLEKTYLSVDLQKDYLDVVNLIFPKVNETSGENIFLFHALSYINGIGTVDKCFQKYFWQYIRIKNQVFEAKVQFNSVSGLDYFQKYYKRSTQYNCYSTMEYWKIIMQNQLQNTHLRKLELRCSIAYKKMKKELAKTMKEFLLAYKKILEEDKSSDTSEQPTFIGLIFHLIKTKDEQGIDKCWQNYFEKMPISEQNNEMYYRNNQEIYLQQVICLNEIRQSIPNIDHFILGIDAASIENNTEPWVFAPAYQEARDSKSSRMLLNGKKLQTLGFTFHVGEDFRHLLTGLRHIDEVISHFGYHAGDRIGHGIALGVDVSYWCKNNPVVIMPRSEYLDDLLWVWGLCKERGNAFDIDISFLEQQILELAERVFITVDGITIFILWKVYQSKFEKFEPAREYKNNFAGENVHSAKLFCRFAPDRMEEGRTHWSYDVLRYVLHCRCYLERLEETIQVEVTDSHARLIRMLQKMLIEKISNQGIVVETNPTSNLTIGEIPDLFHHYIFNLNEISNETNHNSVMVSINSDDPSVFNTNVSNEIAYIFYALQQKGFSREDALLWIDKVRQYGMNTSFIKDRNISKESLKTEISDVINALEGKKQNKRDTFGLQPKTML